jgi:hypothetical protein
MEDSMPSFSDIRELIHNRLEALGDADLLTTACGLVAAVAFEKTDEAFDALTSPEHAGPMYAAGKRVDRKFIEGRRHHISKVRKRR